MKNETTPIAVKAFIHNDNSELLILKRQRTDDHYPNAWDLPGGRVGSTEKLVPALKREVLEETGLKIHKIEPLNVHCLRRPDKTDILIVTFQCLTHLADVSLSAEHTQYLWTSARAAQEALTGHFRDDISIL